jgi:hypothetical protein
MNFTGSAAMSGAIIAMQAFSLRVRPIPQISLIRAGMRSINLSNASMIALCAALAACATTEPPRTSTITNTVKVEVPVPCLAAADIPPLPVTTPLAPGATHRQKDAALASDLQAMDDYAAIADPLLRKCAKP